LGVISLQHSLFFVSSNFFRSFISLNYHPFALIFFSMAKPSSSNKKAQDSDPIDEFTADENEFQNRVQAVVDSIGGFRGQTLNLGTSLETARRETNAGLNKAKNKADRIVAAMKTKAGPSSSTEAIHKLSKRVSLVSIAPI
jgi:hypothetical protein